MDRDADHVFVFILNLFGGGFLELWQVFEVFIVAVLLVFARTLSKHTHLQFEPVTKSGVNE